MNVGTYALFEPFEVGLFKKRRMTTRHGDESSEADSHTVRCGRAAFRPLDDALLMDGDGECSGGIDFGSGGGGGEECRSDGGDFWLGDDVC